MSAALASYRNLMRTIAKTFSGDALALRTARREIKSAFKANESLTSLTEIKQKLDDASEANSFIQEGIVQARRTPMGTYEVDQNQAHQLKHLAPELVNTKGT